MKSSAIRTRFVAFALSVLAFMSPMATSITDVYAASGMTGSSSSQTSNSKVSLDYHNYGSPYEVYTAMEHNDVLDQAFVIDGSNGKEIFWATYSGLKAPSSYFRYVTLGYTVKIEQRDSDGNPTGKSVTVDITSGSFGHGDSNWRGQSALEPGQNYQLVDGIKVYDIRSISLNTLKSYVKAKEGNTNIFDETHCYGITFYNIVSTINSYASSPNARIGQNSNGTVYCSEGNPNEVYRLIDLVDLERFLVRAPWGNPSYFRGIHSNGWKINYGETIVDRILTLEYKVDGKTIKTETLAAGATTNALSNPTGYTAKTGYHLAKYWKEPVSNTYYTFAQTISASDFPSSKYPSDKVTLNGTWEENSYTIQYIVPSGCGTITEQTVLYSDTVTLADGGLLHKEGYTFANWKRVSDGKTFNSGASVSKLTSTDKGTVKFEAVFVPNTYEVELNKVSGTGGTSSIAELYNTYYVVSTSNKTKLTSVSIPSIPGYKFDGYYVGFNGVGQQVVNSNGALTSNATIFTSDGVVYANYSPLTYTITFDKCGGNGGTSSVPVVYKTDYPTTYNNSGLSSPSLKGYVFMGYYTAKNGKGTQIYNQDMGSSAVYELTSNQTLYAYYKDVTAPEVYVTTPTDWASHSEVSFIAQDLGSGLSSITIKVDGVVKKTIDASHAASGFTRAMTDVYKNAQVSAGADGIHYVDVIVSDVGQNVTVTSNGTTWSVNCNITDYN